MWYSAHLELVIKNHNSLVLRSCPSNTYFTSHHMPQHVWSLHKCITPIPFPIPSGPSNGYDHLTSHATACVCIHVIITMTASFSLSSANTSVTWYWRTDSSEHTSGHGRLNSANLTIKRVRSVKWSRFSIVMATVSHFQALNQCQIWIHRFRELHFLQHLTFDLR